jgi:hypothetical protein
VETSIKGMKLGAFDYLLKPIHHDSWVFHSIGKTEACPAFVSHDDPVFTGCKKYGQIRRFFRLDRKQITYLNKDLCYQSHNAWILGINFAEPKEITQRRVYSR